MSSAVGTFPGGFTNETKIATGPKIGGHVMSTGQRQNDFTTSVQNILGNTATFHTPASVNLDMRQGPAHSTTSLPYQIGGTARVVSQKVGTWLASFQDPIRAILGTGIHKEQSIIIRRKYVVGSAATITPERAPARTVAIQEDVREVTLTRYGGDIEMNLNQFLVPGAAEEEMQMKIDAQKMELERTLCDHGYDMLMREGTNICDAIMRSNPAFSSSAAAGKQGEFVKHAHKIYTRQIFGAINKYRFPVTNLLSAARYASAYSVGTQKGSVMILPHGIPDMLRYARRESMEYSISGVKSGEKDKKLTMQLDDVYVDTASDVRILIHHPTPTYAHGAAFPSVENQSGGLTDTTYVISYYPAKAGKAVNVKDGSSHTIKNSEPQYRICKVVASSAILAAPGSDTGELLIGYPFTSVSTSQADERMRVQLRCYLGSVLYQPDNVIIMPNCHVDGIIEEEWVPGGLFDKLLAKTKDPGNGKNNPYEKGDASTADSVANLVSKCTTVDNTGAVVTTVKSKLVDEMVDMQWQFMDADYYQSNCLGAIYNDTDGKAIQVNNAEFGKLDHPELYMGLHGVPATYENADYDVSKRT